MPRPLFHERGIACGTTCDKVPMAKMITMNDLIIISHSYFIFNEKWRLHQMTLKGLAQHFFINFYKIFLISVIVYRNEIEKKN